MKKLSLILIALIAWFAIILQFSISLPEYQQKGSSLIGGFVTVLSYFTVESNILVAICCTVCALNPNRKNFFQKASVQAAIALYIFIVGLIYNTILRQIWRPEGLFRLANELLHVVVPLLFLIYWAIFADKRELKWKNIWPWLIYPLVYLIYSLIRGSITGWYPYPFVDVTKFGYAKVLINSAVVAVAFALFGLAFIGTGRALSKGAKPA